MNPVSVPQLLESVANVTRERDVDHLRLSVIATLQELLAGAAVDFLSLEEPAGAPEGVTGSAAARDLWAGTAPETCSELTRRASAGESTELALDEAGTVLCVHPVAPDQALAVRLQAGVSEDARRIVQAFSRLYVNFNGLIRDSEQDRLTGLHNRRSFDTTLGRLAELTLTAPPAQPHDTAASDRGPLRWWLALFDIDHFKRINDGFGHLYGDEVLLLLARLVRQRFRGEDRCFRYGGEEFAVILARNDHAGAVSAMERLRVQIENHPFPQVGQVTVSIGCAEIEPGLAAADVIDRADRALYDAKRQGRNRLVSWHTPQHSAAAQRRQENVLELF